MAEILCKLPEKTAPKILPFSFLLLSKSIYLTRIDFYYHKHFKMATNLTLLTARKKLFNLNKISNANGESENYTLFQTKIAQKSYPLGPHIPI